MKSDVKEKRLMVRSSETTKVEWLTPPELIRKLGSFDLDPCAPINRPWNTARKHYTKEDDGLKQVWKGRIWCNPPYGLQAAKWLERLVRHGDGIALIYARTEIDMFFRYVWERADAVLFIRGRLFFYHVDGTKALNNSGAPSVLVAYGKNNVGALEDAEIDGCLIYLKGRT